MSTLLDPIKDKRLINVAMRQRWPVSDAIRELLLKKSVEHVQAPDTTIKEKNTAIGLIIKMDQLNLKEQELKVKSQPKLVIHAHMTNEQLVTHISQMAQDLGLSFQDTPALIEAITVKTNQDHSNGHSQELKDHSNGHSPPEPGGGSGRTEETSDSPLSNLHSGQPSEEKSISVSPE